MRRTAGLVLLIFISQMLQAQVKRDMLTGDLVKQKKEKSPDAGAWKKKIFFGGNLGLQFGTITLLDISPMLGFRITDKLHAGIGGTYNYYANRLYNRSTTLYGTRIFGRYFFTHQFFVHAEQEWLYNRFFFYPDNWLDTRLVGIGYRQSLGEHIFFDFMALWNFNNPTTRYYTNPVLRAGFCIR